MEIGQIEAFERSARDGSFTRAADALGLSQPAISARIAALEAELGGPLFERGGRELRLTLLGQRFLPYAQRMLHLVQDSLHDLHNFRNGRLGEVRIAAPGPLVLSFLVETLADFRQQYPTVDVLIRERNKTTIYSMLHDGSITLGLVNAPVFGGRFTQLAHFADPVRPVVGINHPLAKATSPLTLEDLYQHTVFRVSMFPQMTAFIDEIAELARPSSGGAVIAVPMVMALRLVAMGQGVTFLPQSYVQPSIALGEVVFLDVADMPSLISEPVIIARQDYKADHIHSEFIRILKARWRSLLK